MGTALLINPLPQKNLKGVQPEVVPKVQPEVVPGSATGSGIRKGI